MELTELFSATLGLSPPWQVTSITVSEDGQRLEISVDFNAALDYPCPCCGATGTTCRAAAIQETWYHHDFLRYATYIHTKIPQVRCHCGLHTLERPWTRPGSKFVKITPEPGKESSQS